MCYQQRKPDMKLSLNISLPAFIQDKSSSLILGNQMMCWDCIKCYRTGPFRTTTVELVNNRGKWLENHFSILTCSSDPGPSIN